MKVYLLKGVRLVAILLIALVWCLVDEPGHAWGRVHRIDEPPGNELVQYRTPYANFYEQEDGTIRALVSLGAVNGAAVTTAENTTSVADCYVSSRNPNTAQCGQDHIYVGYNTYYYKDKTRSYLKFNLPSRPTGYHVSSARLRMYFYAWQGTSSFTTDIYRVISSWSEGTNPTWYTQPSVDSTSRGSVTISKSAGWKYWTITGLVQDWYGGTTNHGLSVRGRNELEYGGTFYTRERGSNVPVIEITFERNAPTISGLNPASTTAGGSGLTLRVYGSNFFSDSVVRWNGSNRTTTYVSSTELRATVSAGDIATAGTANITVYSPGGGTSSGRTFAINNPVPSTSSLSPSSRTAGGANFTLTVNGSNFVNGAVVRWSGSNRTTTYVSSTELRATIPAGDTATAGTATVTVYNPGPGGGTSSGRTFTINNPVPSISDLNPSSRTVGGTDFTLTVNGSNFVNGAVVRWNGSNRSTTYVSSTELQATIPAGDIATAGTVIVTVYNPGPGGGVSNPHDFLIDWPGGDAYEVDDTCAQGGFFATAAPPQVHTFHSPLDEDWVAFSVALGQDYVIEAYDVRGGADVRLELYGSCAGAVQEEAADAFGPGARLLWTASFNGTLYVRVVNANREAYGHAVEYTLNIREQGATGVAIIVAGHDDDHILQRNINWVTNLAYRTFTGGGLRLDHVYYLNDEAQDADGDGVNDVDGPATLEQLEYALQTWAAPLVNAETPLYLYLMDHGGMDAFLVDGSAGKLTTGQLHAWLSALEDSTDLETTVVIIEACRSGSFIYTPHTISQPGRVIVTSTGPGQNAFASAQGAYFSDAFFTAFGSNKNLYVAFEQGRQAVATNHLAQTPQLDDNGDGISDERDGQNTNALGLANFFAEEEPAILAGEVEFYGAGTGLIKAEVGDDMGLARVWVEIYPPSFVEPPPGEDFETPELDIVRQDLQDYDSDGWYTVTYSDFTELGTYHIVVYAQDLADNLAVPHSLTLQIGSKVYLPLLIRF